MRSFALFSISVCCLAALASAPAHAQSVESIVKPLLTGYYESYARYQNAEGDASDDARDDAKYDFASPLEKYIFANTQSSIYLESLKVIEETPGDAEAKADLSMLLQARWESVYLLQYYSMVRAQRAETEIPITIVSELTALAAPQGIVWRSSLDAPRYGKLFASAFGLIAAFNVAEAAQSKTLIPVPPASVLTFAMSDSLDQRLAGEKLRFFRKTISNVVAHASGSTATALWARRLIQAARVAKTAGTLGSIKSLGISMAIGISVDIVTREAVELFLEEVDEAKLNHIYRDSLEAFENAKSKKALLLAARKLVDAALTLDAFYNLDLLLELESRDKGLLQVGGHDLESEGRRYAILKKSNERVAELLGERGTPFAHKKIQEYFVREYLSADPNAFQNHALPSASPTFKNATRKTFKKFDELYARQAFSGDDQQKAENFAIFLAAEQKAALDSATFTIGIQAKSNRLPEDAYEILFMTAAYIRSKNHPILNLYAEQALMSRARIYTLMFDALEKR